ncbi:MAG TPA: hypothetical protein VJ650_15895, partial [Gemmatimonadaceae bacterium]|nr:hypothetical protein [Gemmatimonadaceae bacterium]
MAYVIRYARSRRLLLPNGEASFSKRCTWSRLTLHRLFLTLAAVTLGCAGAPASSRSSGNGEQRGRGIIGSSSATPIRTDSLEYRPQGTPPRQYIVIRATFTNVSNDTTYLGWCRAPTLPNYALEDYSAGTWSRPPGIYGLTCLDEGITPLMLAPSESH